MKPLFRNGKKQIEGQGIVEFAIVLLFFFAFLFVFVDMIRIGYAWGGLEMSTHKASREARNAIMATEVAAATSILVNSAQNLGINLSSSQVGMVRVGSMMQISVDYPLTINPLSGILLKIAGNEYTGVYTLRYRKELSNEIPLYT